MAQIKTSRLGLAAVVVLAVALSPLGCSSSNSNNSPTPSNGGASATGGSAPTAGNPGAGNGGQGNGGQSTCVLDPTNQCYEASATCTPSTNAELLDQCTSATCYRYDNAAHGLPVPAVP
jgi:hypothetical protein